jgi:hypothetical protein
MSMSGDRYDIFCLQNTSERQLNELEGTLSDSRCESHDKIPFYFAGRNSDVSKLKIQLA